MIGFDKDKLLLMRENELSNAHKTFDNQISAKNVLAKAKSLFQAPAFAPVAA